MGAADQFCEHGLVFLQVLGETVSTAERDFLKDLLSAAQNLSTARSGQRPVFKGNNPVDEYVGDSSGQVVGVESRAGFGEGLGGKDDQVGSLSCAEHAPIRKAQPLCWQGGEAADRFLGRERSLVADKVAEEPSGPGIGTVKGTSGEWAVGGEGGGVGADHAPGMGKDRAQIFLAIAEGDDHWGVQIVDLGKQDIADCVEGFDIALDGDFGDALAAVFGLVLALVEDDAFPIAAGQSGDDTAMGLYFSAGGRVL